MNNCAFVVVLLILVCVVVWIVFGGFAISNQAPAYFWNLRAVETNSTVINRNFYNSTYLGLCDSRCINNCIMCRYMCYDAQVEFLYSVAMNDYTFYETKYTCYANYTKMVEDLNATYPNDSQSMVWYDSENSKDYSRELKPNSFIAWIIAYFSVIGVVIVIIAGIIIFTK